MQGNFEAGLPEYRFGVESSGVASVHHDDRRRVHHRNDRREVQQ
jgi:hypothetical protein